jgi:hypothetical protein
MKKDEFPDGMIGGVICAYHEKSTPWFMASCTRFATVRVRHFDEAPDASTPCCRECADLLLLSGDWDVL